MNRDNESLFICNCYWAPTQMIYVPGLTFMTWRQVYWIFSRSISAGESRFHRTGITTTRGSPWTRNTWWIPRSGLNIKRKQGDSSRNDTRTSSCPMGNQHRKCLVNVHSAAAKSFTSAAPLCCMRCTPQLNHAHLLHIYAAPAHAQRAQPRRRLLQPSMCDLALLSRRRSRCNWL